eukprot:g4440.t1
MTGSPSWAISTENLLFLEAWRGVDRAYVDKNFNEQNWLKLREQYLKKEPMNNRKETYAAIEKMLLTLGDPFTRFLEPAKLLVLKEGTKGVVTGVGMEVAYSTKPDSETELTVIAPAPGGPALRAGIQSGDVLVEIDGIPTKDESIYTVGEMLQGDPGSQVKLTLRNQRSGQIQSFDLIREQVKFNPVSFKYCPSIPGVNNDIIGNIGYIQIARFTDQTPLDVRQAIQTLQSKGTDRFVLDLRNNGGGSFPAGISVSRMWLESGDIVLIADTQGIRDIVSTESSSVVDTTTPLTVIINHGTASASEIFSGAIQDNNRGVIVGETSFGKGLIQTLIPLSDGSGITVTTAKYQTPSGKDINGTGIQPDIKITLPVTGGGNKDGICESFKTSTFQSLLTGLPSDRVKTEDQVLVQ